MGSKFQLFKKTDVSSMTDAALQAHVKKMSSIIDRLTLAYAFIFIAMLVTGGIWGVIPGEGLLFVIPGLCGLPVGCSADNKRRAALAETVRRKLTGFGSTTDTDSPAMPDQSMAPVFNAEAAITLQKSITGMKPLNVSKRNCVPSVPREALTP